ESTLNLQKSKADAGLIDVTPGYLIRGSRTSPVSGPGQAVTDAAYTEDLTPPPTPEGFAVAAAFENLLITVSAQSYTAGGHGKTRLYGSTINGATFGTALLLMEFVGTVASYPATMSTTYRLWATNVSNDGVESVLPAPTNDVYGLSATTAMNVAATLGALSGEITSSQLNTTLNSRVDLIDGGVTQPTLPYPLAYIAALQDGANQVIRRDLDATATSLLDSVLKISATNQTVHDAGINVNQTTGVVEIYGEGNINLKASTTYVDNAIALAVIDPSQVPIFGQLEVRVAAAEVDISSLESAVTLKASNIELSASNVRITDAETSIDAMNGQILDRVTSGDFTSVTGGLDTRVGSAETVLASIGDTSVLANLVQQSSSRLRSEADTAETMLRQLLNGEQIRGQSEAALSFAREELYAHTEDGIFAEATKRTALAVAVGES
ncbi:hypothetical protein JZU54_07625, partial [bacterium]|nr:hypothetical protein [bacterium]